MKKTGITFFEDQEAKNKARARKRARAERGQSENGARTDRGQSEGRVRSELILLSIRDVKKCFNTVHEKKSCVVCRTAKQH